MKTRLIACLLSVLLLTPTLAACGGQTSSGNETTPAADTTAPVSSEDTTTGFAYVPDDLPEDMDFGGATVGIYVHPYAPDELIPTSETDIVSVAVSKRNQALEERLKVKINAIANDETNESYGANLVKQVLAGDDTYRIALSSQYISSMYQYRNIFLNLHDNTILDFSKPWWGTQEMETVKVRDDLLYQLYGDANFCGIGYLACIFMNKQIIDDRLSEIGADGLYQLALDGKWTLDKLEQYVRATTVDLDGDQVIGENDLYGYSYFYDIKGLILSTGVTLCGREEDGTPYIALSSERNADAVEALTSFHSDADSIKFTPYEYTYFLNSQAAFEQTWLSASYEEFRNTEFDYGILPLPKLNEQQEDYRSRRELSSSTYSIVSTATAEEAELCATFLEALASASYRSVLPVYYEKALRTKYTHDSTSGQVIDLIHDSAYSDFADVYGDKTDNPIEVIQDIIRTNTGTFGSRAASIEGACQKSLEKYLKKFEKLN